MVILIFIVVVGWNNSYLLLFFFLLQGWYIYSVYNPVSSVFNLCS